MFSETNIPASVWTCGSTRNKLLARRARARRLGRTHHPIAVVAAFRESAYHTRATSLPAPQGGVCAWRLCREWTDVSETLRSGARSGDVGDGEGEARLFRFTLYRGVEVNAARTHGLGCWCCWAMIRRAGLGERRDGGRPGRWRRARR